MPSEEEETEEVDDEELCLAPPSTTTPPETTSEPSPSPPPLNHPVTTGNFWIRCRDGTHQWASRAKMIQAIDRFCAAIAGRTLRPREVFTKRESWECCGEGEVVPVGTETIIEVKSGCEWKVDEYECGQQLRLPVDKCDEDGENRKQGGFLENNCLKWSIDVLAYG
ncbi:hypothetical protein H2201_009127 [Coniosporium apollinis]|uniref:SRCR domain-containing protein n=1 Tax=Coniosporium apollinis TaxID=61459 RepID=A0ABQ9NJH7_9PEZI|nr:hypothetical protein H2201_009127 [Coniosporium apollinis]